MYRPLEKQHAIPPQYEHLQKGTGDREYVASWFAHSSTYAAARKLALFPGHATPP